MVDDSNSHIDLKKLMEAIEKYREGDKYIKFHLGEDRFDHPFSDRLEMPYKKPLREIDQGVLDFGYFSGKNICISAVGERRFQHQSHHIYHGTSIQALDLILETRMLRTGGDLHRKGELVWGEIKRDLGDAYEPRGPKYLTIEALERIGIELTEEDRKIFGHAFAVFFSAHPIQSSNYTPKDPDQRAIIGVHKPALENLGYKFVDCGSEGIKGEGNIDLNLGLQVLLVPVNRVGEYEEKVRGKYLASVYPL